MAQPIARRGWYDRFQRLKQRLPDPGRIRQRIIGQHSPDQLDTPRSQIRVVTVEIAAIIVVEATRWSP